MFLERLLQVNIAALTALSALLLGMGERSALLPMGMLLAAFGSIWVTDVTGWFRLNPRVTQVAVVLAVLVSLWELVQLRTSYQVLAIANLLVYVQVISLFQRKDLRIYRQLIVVSLIQVVIAAAFNQGSLFGFLLVFYLAAGMSAMTLLFLYQERGIFAGTPPSQPVVEGAVPSSGRWPLVAARASFTAARPSGRDAVGRELWTRLARVTFGTLLLAWAIFFITPRLGRSAWHGPGGALRQSVGFSEKVALGELGKIIENPQEVLTIHFLDDAARQPYRVEGEVYLRGCVLDYYRRGRWYAVDSRGADRHVPVERGVLLPREELVRQVITIEPMDRPELFCVWPFVGAGPSPDRRIAVAERSRRLVRLEEYAGRKFTFELATTAFHQGAQSLLTAGDGPVPVRRLLAMPPAEGGDALPGLAAQARRWLAEAPLDPEDRLNRARLLERMLRDSGQYQYSLEGQMRDRALDPIEDFITRHRRGHCEYFATALVLMLRSQGIPARLVVGFKTDEWNDLGGFFQVRQLHAHTWVEVFLDPRHLPEDLIRGHRHWEWADGGWLRLDPTPEGGASESRTGPSLWNRIDRYSAWIDYLWNRYVVEMDSPRQREAIYRPLLDALEQAARRAADPAWWRDVFRRAGQAVWGKLKALGGWWILAVAAAGATGAAMLFLLVRLARRRLLKGLAGQARQARGGAEVDVEFYRRLETLLAQQGLARAASQTHREFAHQASAMLAQAIGQSPLGDVPVAVAEAFYRVRFGGEPLEPAELDALEASLERLERGVGEASRHAADTAIA